MNNLTPQKRKSSLPLEKKLEVYEFEVDENEPKIKQKKKRGPKPGGKGKGKRVVSKKIGVISPTKNDTNKKYPTKLKNTLENWSNQLLKKKNALVSSVKNEIQKEVLSTKNSSSPLFENKRRQNEELRHAPPRKLIENVIQPVSEDDTLKNEVQKNVLRSSSRISRKKGSAGQNENKMLTESDQKENLIHSESKENNQSETYRNFLTPKKRTSNIEIIRKNSRGNENVTTSTPFRNESSFYNTIEVPVLFHNAQNASPLKNNKLVHNQKPCFSAMSDDENINKSYRENALDHLFYPSERSIGNKDGPSRSSFYHNSSYDCDINASTPVKYNDDTCNSSVHNCFGFDELEVFEEPLVSPIKIIDGDKSDYSEASHVTPYKAPSKKVDTPEKKDEIPVTQVIRMLKFGTDDDNVETRSKSSSNGTSPIFNDVEEDTRIMEEVTIIKPGKLGKAAPRVPRRSYERPAYLRKKNKSFEEEEENSDEDIQEKIVKPKRKNGPSKKEKDEMQKWIKAFNSQCQEIEKFDLLVE